METNCICLVVNEMSTIVDICVFELLYPHTKRFNFQCLFTLEKKAWECNLKMLYTYVWLPGLLSKSNWKDAPYFEAVFCIYHFQM